MTTVTVLNVDDLMFRRSVSNVVISRVRKCFTDDQLQTTGLYCKNVLWSGMVWLICLIVSLLAICLTLLVTCVHADYYVFKLL